MFRPWIVLALVTPLCAQMPVRSTPAVPVEYGRVDWRRGYELARAEARVTHRPLLVLFQEVPG